MENNGSISAQSSIDIPMEKDNFQDGRDVWNSKLSNEQFVKLFGTAAATNVDEESDYDGRNDSRASSVNSTGSGITGKLATGGTGILSSLISGTSNAVSKGVNAVVGSASIADISDQTNELNINKSNGSDRIDGKRLRDSMYTIRSKYSKAIRSHSKSDYPDGNHNDNFEGSTNDRANSRNNSTDKKSNGNFPLSYDPDLEKLPTFAHVDSFQVKETFSDVLRNSDSSDDEVDSSSDEEENYERKSNDFVNNFTLHEEVTTMPDMESLNIIDGIRHRTSSN